MIMRIRIPQDATGLLVVASVSGGKDSTALILALLEAVDRGEIPRHLLRFAFADTGWEAPETYVYLDYLRENLDIEIVVVGVEGGMRARIAHRAAFPGRMQRWCTRELKIDPLRAYHDRLTQETGIETVNAMGVRAAESAPRAKMAEWADEPEGQRSWGGYVWRPLLQWTIEDVLTIHNRHGVKVNPLYQRGHSRVGCYPCIYAGKEEIALIAQHSPERIDEIRQLETDMLALRIARNEEQPGRYKHVDDASFFQTRARGVSGIEAVVKWARTDHGGKQFPLFAPAPQGGCMRWGICDMPDERGFSQQHRDAEANASPEHKAWAQAAEIVMAERPTPHAVNRAVSDHPDEVAHEAANARAARAAMGDNCGVIALFVCSVCGWEQDSDSRPCGRSTCRSLRVVAISFVEKIFGSDWRKYFE